MLNKEQIIEEIEHLKHLLDLAVSSVQNNYLSAAASYLGDVESETIRLASDCQEHATNAKEPIAANFFHSNDPAYVPYTDGNE